MKLNRLASLGLLVGLIGCQAVDPALMDPEGRPIDSLPPVSYTVAIAPLDQSTTPLEVSTEPSEDAAESAYRFTLDSAEVQRRIVVALDQLNAASRVVSVGEDSQAEAIEKRADLVVRPRLRVAPALEYESTSDLVVPATLWWLTWIGGLYVDGSRYTADMEVEYQIVNPHDNLVIDSFVARSDYVDLAFFDRNSLWSWAGVQSLFLPPYWTSDSADMTSESISDQLCTRFAGRLTQYLKLDLAAAERDSLGELRLQTPSNGEDVGPRASFHGKVVAGEPITAVTLFVNDAEEPALEMRDDTISTAEAQRVGNVYQVFLDHTVDLVPGDNLVAIEMEIAGRLTSRTLRLRNGRIPESGDE